MGKGQAHQWPRFQAFRTDGEGMSEVVWTKERLQELERIWVLNLSMSIMGRLLGGVSRGAVSSAVKRGRAQGYNLPPRIVAAGASGKPQRATRQEPSLPKPPSPLPPSEDISDGVPTELLQSHSCRWALNDGPNWLFCGREKCDHGAYCSEHRARSISQAAQRRVG